jgi:hypothetical protein
VINRDVLQGHGLDQLFCGFNQKVGSFVALGIHQEQMVLEKV